jgi:hypothetical protein
MSDIQRWIDSLKPIQNVSYSSPYQAGMQTMIEGVVYRAYDVVSLLSKIEADHVAALAQAQEDWNEAVLIAHRQGQRDALAKLQTLAESLLKDGDEVGYQVIVWALAEVKGDSGE